MYGHRAAEVLISKQRPEWSLGCGVCLDLGQEAMVRPFAVEFENPGLGLARDGSAIKGFGICFLQQPELPLV